MYRWAILALEHAILHRDLDRKHKQRAALGIYGEQLGSLSICTIMVENYKQNIPRISIHSEENILLISACKYNLLKLDLWGKIWFVSELK